MKRVGFMLKVKKEMVEEYRAKHVNVWPEMREALSRTGWHNYSLYLRDDGLLFGYVETDNGLQPAIDAMTKEEVNARWQKVMTPFFENVSGDRPDQMMMELEEVFHLD